MVKAEVTGNSAVTNKSEVTVATGTSVKLKELIDALQRIAPLGIAESWDNVGLLVGDPASSIAKVMTCLTLSDSVLEEAIDRKIGLVVSHHPIPFRPLTRITTEDPTGRILWRAMQHSIAIYSPHTAWDNAHEGINRQLAGLLHLGNLRPLVPLNRAANSQSGNSQTGKVKQGTSLDDPMERELGCGVIGEFAKPVRIDDLVERLGVSIRGMSVRCTDSGERLVNRIGIVCGSGGSMLSKAAGERCDLFLTGEATYHQCLEAEARGVAMLMIGHFASEAFSMRKLAELLARAFPQLDVGASESESSVF
jgi:dinuclear metal center YbgI/SA1388 family protein